MHPVIQDWFRGKFESPTAAQAEGWPAIAQGRHTLIAAPTGSGKTLAAFLTCIDTLVRAGMQGDLPDATQVVYVSPLKALSNDVQKNLSTPLSEISELAEEAGVPFPEIRVAVRTGDTQPAERQRMAKKPPHILITTPESLYILLTSKSGRAGLGQVKTLILDEIHAVADGKRGSHLALSVERLCALTGEPVARIGLSATQRPIQEIARLLVGVDNISADGTPQCLIVDSGHTRSMDLDLHMPSSELGPIASHELWAETLDTVAALAQEHGATLVFCNTRRMVERVAHQLSERLGDDSVVPHHGSLSRTTRLEAEQKLKAGLVKVCVATASLELGIDIGEVNLVCQLGSPRSISLVLQRVGRSGHTVGGTPKGRLFPLTRDELVECTALLKGIRGGNLDSRTIPPWPLDVLSQQIVAACVPEEWDEDALFRLCRRAYSYRELPRERFEQVLTTLSQGFAGRLGRKGALLHRDGVNRQVKARRGAGIAAMTSGGAIPDNADYDVIADPEETFVGTVNEDFAIESLAGDIFLLGNTPWKIRRVESGKVRVEDAQGQSPSVPFWLGEAPGRTPELCDEVTLLREEVDRRLDRPGEAEAWVMAQAGVGSAAARQLVAYLEEGKRVLGMVPTGRRVVAERFFDDSGGMQLVIHAPFGARVNRAWGMALRKQICRSFDFELQASATDDGINLSLAPNLSFPLGDIFSYVSRGTVERVLGQAVLQAPLFAVRWRWTATRSLAVLRHSGGRKVPAPLVRMRSDDLLAAVFPAQAACQDNGPGYIEIPDDPLTFETMRDCLTEAMDLPGLSEILESIDRGETEVYARDTVQPSVFSHQILNAMPYAFLDGAPLEERRARAVSLRRALPEDAKDLSSLDPAAIMEESYAAWPRIRDADELHDALLVLGILPEREAQGRDPDRPDLAQWFSELARGGRAHRLVLDGPGPLWIAAERLPLAAALGPQASPQLRPGAQDAGAPVSAEEAVLAVVRGWAECSGPFRCSALAGALGLDRGAVAFAVGQLENEGVILRGRFSPGTDEDEFCDRRILARIHRATIGRLRREIEPVSPAEFVGFLFQWQHVAPAAKLHGEDGVLDAVEMLQGFETAAGALESEVLAPRVVEYKPAYLDRLTLGGEVVWGRLSPARDDRGSTPVKGALTRATPISIALRESLEWLLERHDNAASGLPGPSGEVLSILSRRGASFLSEIAAFSGLLPSHAEEAMWQLAAMGRVTSDGIEPLRSRIGGRANGNGHARAGHRPGRPRRAGLRRRSGYSRWSLLEALDPAPDPVEHWARQLLLRYGVLFPELLAREAEALRWRELVRMLRLLESRGEIRGGRFVSGFIGEQFALPEAVDALRSHRSRGASGQYVVVSACDPLNLAGILTPGERVPAVLGNRVVFRDGAPICSLESGNVVERYRGDPQALDQARRLLARPPGAEAADMSLPGAASGV